MQDVGASAFSQRLYLVGTNGTVWYGRDLLIEREDSVVPREDGCDDAEATICADIGAER